MGDVERSPWDIQGQLMDAAADYVATDPMGAAQDLGYIDGQAGTGMNAAQVDPSYQYEYEEGYDAGVQDATDAVMAQPYDGPAVNPWSAQQEAEAEQAERDSAARVQQLLGRKTGIGRAIYPKGSQDPLSQETEPDDDFEPPELVE